MKDFETQVCAIAVGPGSFQLAVATPNTLYLVYETISQKTQDRLYHLQFSPDGSFLVGCAVYHIFIWDATTLDLIFSTWSMDIVLSMTILENGTIARGGYRGEVLLIDIPTFTKKTIAHNYGGYELHTFGPYLMYNCLDIWNTESLQHWSFDNINETQAIAFHRKGYFAIKTEFTITMCGIMDLITNSMEQLWSTPVSTPVVTPHNFVTTLHFSPHGQWLLYYKNECLQVLSVATGRLLSCLVTGLRHFAFTESRIYVGRRTNHLDCIKILPDLEHQWASMAYTNSITSGLLKQLFSRSLRLILIEK